MPDEDVAGYRGQMSDPAGAPASRPLIPTMRDRMLAGEPYVADSTVAELTTAAQVRAAAYNASSPTDPDERRRLLVELLGQVRPQYEVLPGWRQPTGGARRLADLPAEARAYLDRLQALSGVPARYVSVGTRRDQIIEVEG